MPSRAGSSCEGSDGKGGDGCAGGGIIGSGSAEGGCTGGAAGGGAKGGGACGGGANGGGSTGGGSVGGGSAEGGSAGGGSLGGGSAEGGSAGGGCAGDGSVGCEDGDCNGKCEEGGCEGGSCEGGGCEGGCCVDRNRLLVHDSCDELDAVTNLRFGGSFTWASSDATASLCEEGGCEGGSCEGGGCEDSGCVDRNRLLVHDSCDELNAVTNLRFVAFTWSASPTCTCKATLSSNRKPPPFTTNDLWYPSYPSLEGGGCEDSGCVDRNRLLVHDSCDELNAVTNLRFVAFTWSASSAATKSL